MTILENGQGAGSSYRAWYSLVVPTKRQPKGSQRGGQYAPSPPPEDQSVDDPLTLGQAVPSPSTDTEIIAHANRPIPLWCPRSLKGFKASVEAHKQQGDSSVAAHNKATDWLYKHGVKIDEAPITHIRQAWLDAEKEAVDASREFSDELNRSFASGLCRADTPDINEARQTTVDAAEQAQRLRETYFATI